MNDQSEAGGEIGSDLSFKNLFQWAVLLVKSPKQFFTNLTKTGGYGVPMVYALFWLFLGSMVEFGVSKIRPAAEGAPDFPLVMELVLLLLAPFLLLLMGFIGAAVLFVLWHLMGSPNNYRAAFRCWAMMAPVSVFSALLGIYQPLSLLAFLYGTFLLINASKAYHGISTKKSCWVWGSIAVVVLALVGLSTVLQKNLQQQGLLGGRPGFTRPLPDFGADEEVTFEEEPLEEEER